MSTRRSFLATVTAALATPFAIAKAMPEETITGSFDTDAMTLADVFEAMALRTAQRTNPDRFEAMYTPEVHEAWQRRCAEVVRQALVSAGKQDTADWLDVFYEQVQNPSDVTQRLEERLSKAALRAGGDKVLLK